MQKYRNNPLIMLLLLVLTAPFITLASEQCQDKKSCEEQAEAEGSLIIVDVSGTPYEVYKRIINNKNRIAYINQPQIRRKKSTESKSVFELMNEIQELSKRLEQLAEKGDVPAQVYFADIKLHEAHQFKRQYDEWKEDAILSGTYYKWMTEAYNTALKWLKVAANNKDAESALELGRMYQEGDGVKISNLAAIEWYYKYSVYSKMQGDREAALHGLELIQALSPNHFLAQKLSDSLYGNNSSRSSDVTNGSGKNEKPRWLSENYPRLI